MNGGGPPSTGPPEVVAQGQSQPPLAGTAIGPGPTGTPSTGPHGHPHPLSQGTGQERGRNPSRVIMPPPSQPQPPQCLPPNIGPWQPATRPRPATAAQVARRKRFMC